MFSRTTWGATAMVSFPSLTLGFEFRVRVGSGSGSASVFGKLASLRHTLKICWEEAVGVRTRLRLALRLALRLKHRLKVRISCTLALALTLKLEGGESA